MKVCLASCRLLWAPTLGGHAWVNLNWAFGLVANGVAVTFLESVPPDVDPPAAARRIAAFRSQLAALGLKAEIAIVPSDRSDPPEHTVPFERVVAETDLLLNFNYGLVPAVVARFARSLLVDIDPGLLQMWVSGGAFSLPPHDLYFTIGETVGQPAARFPDCGLRWHYTPPPVHLPAWPPTMAAGDAPFTTVTNWWAAFEVDRGEVFNNEKRTSFMEYLDLPRRTDVALELAIYHEQGNWSEFPLLHGHGWRARPAAEVSATPQAYRSYIQGSRGEFSCAKPSCMRLQNAWISDRTLCYLASGKPCVVQHTGASRFLPDAAGLFRFRTMDEAVGCLATATADYAHQCRLARALAAEHFDAQRIVASVLTRSA
jgi:hypothetical protein